METMTKQTRKARDTLLWLLIGGLILTTVGVMQRIASTSSGGSDFGMFLGGIGGTLVWVALTGYAVMLGIRAARD